jgi:hypothetical protein
MPLFESGTVAEKALPARVYADFGPATRLDNPRGTSSNGTRSA